MSNIHGLIPHQPGYYYIRLEEDYVAMFEAQALRLFEKSSKTEDEKTKRDARLTHTVAKAYISSVLENLSNWVYQHSESEDDIWVYLAFPDLEARLHGAYKERTLKNAMKELIDDGYVFKRPNSDRRFKALEYRMNVKQYRQEMGILPTKIPNNGAKMHDNGAKMHDNGAKMHDNGAKMHDNGAKMHDDQCKNAPTHRAFLHASNNRVESTIEKPKEKKDQKQRNEKREDYATVVKKVLADANDALALISSLFGLNLKDAQQVLQAIHELQFSPSVQISSVRTEKLPDGQNEWQDTKPSNRKRKDSTTANAKFLPTTQAILDAWDEINERKIPRTEENGKFAEVLAQAEATAADLRAVREHLLGQKDGWWKSRGVRLKDIVNNFNLASQSAYARRPGQLAFTIETSGGQMPDVPLERPPKQRQRLERITRVESTQGSKREEVLV